MKELGKISYLCTPKISKVKGIVGKKRYCLFYIKK